MNEEEILGSVAEGIIAIDLAMEVIETAPAVYFEGEAKKEFARIEKMVEAAEKCEPGKPSEAWSVFLHYFMLDAIDNVKSIKAEIKNTLKELKAQEGRGKAGENVGAED